MEIVEEVFVVTYLEPCEAGGLLHINKTYEGAFEFLVKECIKEEWNDNYYDAYLPNTPDARWSYSDKKYEYSTIYNIKKVPVFSNGQPSKLA